MTAAGSIASIPCRPTSSAETTPITIADQAVSRIAAVWAPSDNWKVTPSYYYQDRYANDVQNYWPLYSNPGSDRYVSANPTQRTVPDTFYIPALKIEGDLGAVTLISNTSYYHRKEETGYDGTLYNLGFYQTFFGGAVSAARWQRAAPAAGAPRNYRSPASVDNDQQNLTQEIRLQSSDLDVAADLDHGIVLFGRTARLSRTDSRSAAESS